MKKLKIFLGGTCNNSKWREQLIEMLRIDYFNPIVENWTPECQAEEIKQRQECDFCLYVITPEMTGVYSIAEAIDDSNKRPEKTIFCVPKDYEPEPPYHFSESQLLSLNATGRLIQENGGYYLNSLESVAVILNSLPYNTCEHLWMVYGTAISPPTILVICDFCKKRGIVLDFSVYEWSDAYYAPQKSYRFINKNNVIILTDD